MIELFDTTLNFEQIYLIVFAILYFGLVLGIRTLILFKRTGINPMEKFGRKSNHFLAERLISLAVLIFFVVVGNHLILTRNIKFLIPIQFLDLNWIMHTGFVMICLGLLSTFIAQLQMKDSWRIGLDQGNQIQLIDQGFFAHSRNPIYVALMIAYLGVFLVVPSIISLIFVILMGIGLHLKVKGEEDFLEKRLGEQYMEYKGKVPRWF